MPEYLENPRRVPREAVHCRARLFLPTGVVEATTEDIGSRGCRLVLSVPVQRGEVVALALTAPRYDATLRVDGRIAWVSPKAPWHVGIAYAVLALPGAARWMEGLRQAVPELFPVRRRSQDRLPIDAMVFLGHAPTNPEFGEDELAVLRMIDGGARIGELRTTLSRAWPRMQRALFALLGQGYVTISRADAGHPVTWRHVLGGDAAPALSGTIRVPTPMPVPTASPPALPEGTRAAPVSRRVSERMDGGGDAPVPTPTPHRASTPGGTRMPTLAPGRIAIPTPPRLAAPTAPRTPTPPPRSPTTPAPTRLATPGRTPVVGTPAGRRPGQPRSPEVETLYQLGLAELQAHHSHGAMALLRRALALSPGDPDISSAIGRALRGE